MTIASLLARKGVKVVTIQPEHQIRQALALLAEHNIGALVVVDPGARPIGILSERDVVRAAIRDERGVFDKPVSALMTRNVIMGVPQDDLVSVGSTMTEKRIRHLPVVENGNLVGVISIGDLVKAVIDEQKHEIEDLRRYIAG